MRWKKKIWLACCIILSMFLCACGNANVPKTDELDTEAYTSEQPTEVVLAETEIVSETEEASIDIIPETFSYTMVVQINPLVELYFDENNMVIGVAYLNQDAVDAYEQLDIVGNDLDTSMGMIVTAAIEQGYVKEEATVSIEIAQVGEDITEIDTNILIESSQVASETIATMMGEDATVMVEISVSDVVTEQTGATGPTVCPDCNGTGNDCKECNGTGDVRCKRCNNGIESCGTCGGTAIINCHGCHGSGIDGPQGETCRRCGGSGKQSCDACNGAGTFLCSWCKGALHHICPDCWGEGSCSTCGGDGIL